MAFVSQYNGMLASKGDLGNLGLISQARRKVVLELCRVIDDYFLRSSMVFLSTSTQLTVGALSKCKQLLLGSQNHTVIVTTCNFNYLLVLEKGYQLWYW